VKIGVCLSQVPASDSRIKINADNTGVDLAGVKWEINPYDEFALEAGLRLKDEKKATDVIVFTVGGADADQRIKDALARGATGAVRIDDPGLAGSDSLGIARALAAATKAEGCDAVFCGKQAIDGDNAQVPGMIAEVLGWPQVLVVDQLEIADGAFKAWRGAGSGGRDVVEGKLPAVISTDKGLNEPRYASLRGIMKAKRKKFPVKSLGDLGVEAGSVGSAGAHVMLSNWSQPPARPPGRILEGEPAAAAKELVRLLRDEAKVI
jgi:electron transfer flavoprotein beta subunit